MIARRLLRSLALLSVALFVVASSAAESARWAIAIHGGAGSWQGLSGDQTDAIKADLRLALTKGRDILANGGASIDAVEQAIRILEDSPRFNAGRGGVVNVAGKHQLDASIMQGGDLQAGAVAAITVAKNPITAARRVMVDTPHVLLAGEGADVFAREAGLDLVDPDYFWTRERCAAFRKEKERAEQSRTDGPPHHYGTVGCVALDQLGQVAAGTSTGGLQGKRVGRVGDSPLIAAGTYADNRAGAISCTGVGELFIRNVIAYDILARVRYQVSDPAAAIDHHLLERLEPGTGGVIVVCPTGELYARFNTAAMPRGMADSEGRFDVAFGESE